MKPSVNMILLLGVLLHAVARPALTQANEFEVLVFINSVSGCRDPASTTTITGKHSKANALGYDWSLLKGGTVVATFNPPFAQPTVSFKVPGKCPNQDPFQVNACGSGNYRVRCTATYGLAPTKVARTSNSVKVAFTNKTVDMKLNGSSAPVVASCGASSILIDGTGTTCEDAYFVSVQESDKWWNRFGPEVTKWHQGEAPANFDLAKFANDGNLDFKGGKYYRVKLAIGNPWQETSRLVYFMPATVDMTINDNPESFMEVDANNVIMDGSFSFCEIAYFVSMQLSDANWGRFGPEYSQWFKGEAPHDFRVDEFWKDKSGGTSLQSGQYYRVKLAVEGPWQQEEKLILVK